MKIYPGFRNTGMVLSSWKENRTFSDFKGFKYGLSLVDHEIYVSDSNEGNSSDPRKSTQIAIYKFMSNVTTQLAVFKLMCDVTPS